MYTKEDMIDNNMSKKVDKIIIVRHECNIL